MSSSPGLLQRAVYGSVALHQPRSELTSRVSVVTKSHVEDQGLVGYLRPCQCLITVPPRGHADLDGWCCHMGHTETSGYRLLSRAVSGSVALWGPGLGWCLWLQLPPRALHMSGVRPTTWDHIDAPGAMLLSAPC